MPLFSSGFQSSGFSPEARFSASPPSSSSKVSQVTPIAATTISVPHYVPSVAEPF